VVGAGGDARPGEIPVVSSSREKEQGEIFKAYNRGVPCYIPKLMIAARSILYFQVGVLTGEPRS